MGSKKTRAEERKPSLQPSKTEKKVPEIVRIQCSGIKGQ